MPLHWHRDWDWDWDWHHHQYPYDHQHHHHHHRPFWLRSWPWYSSYLKCPWLTDFDVCALDWTTTTTVGASPTSPPAAAAATTTTTATAAQAATTSSDNKSARNDEAPWCHHTCLSGSVGIESGDELNSHGKGTYKILIDVHHFRAEELRVRVKNSDTIIIEGKHQAERATKAGICITRQFTRRHRLPRYYDATQAQASLSTDGILMVWIPPPPPLDEAEREVEIVPTGTYFGNTEASPNTAPAAAGNVRAIENDSGGDGGTGGVTGGTDGVTGRTGGGTDGTGGGSGGAAKKNAD